MIRKKKIYVSHLNNLEMVLLAFTNLVRGQFADRFYPRPAYNNQVEYLRVTVDWVLINIGGNRGLNILPVEYIDDIGSIW